MRKSIVTKLFSLCVCLLLFAGCGGGGGGSGTGLIGGTASAGSTSDPGTGTGTGTTAGGSGRVVITIPLVSGRAVKNDVAAFRVTLSQGDTVVLSQEFTRAEREAAGQQVVFNDVPEGTYDLRILYLSATGTELGHFDQILIVDANGGPPSRTRPTRTACRISRPSDFWGAELFPAGSPRPISMKTGFSTSSIRTP